ncbi:MAG TPA: VOC family protein [Thermoanaerobaculia bacterium]|nr:VOC family protein [Thermoanaerobaculia bacterium]
MSETPKPQVGTIAWTDLTVPNADEVRDFYAAVTGWKPEALSMGDYSDYVMSAPGGTGVAGVCHARGTNAGLPQQWLIYITVESVDESIRQCEQRGGKVIAGPKKMGAGKYCVIQDPAGAVAALIDTGEKQV